MSKNGTGSRAEERKVSAAQRLEVSKDRTPEQQLARLNAAGLTAKKERAKLEARIKTRVAAPKPNSTKAK